MLLNHQYGHNCRSHYHEYHTSLCIYMEVRHMPLWNKANLRDWIAATSLVISNWIQSIDFSACVTLKFDVSTKKTRQALCIISNPSVNSNRSYGLETAKWGHDLCDLEV